MKADFTSNCAKTEHGMMDLVTELVDRHGSQTAVARLLGISTGQLGDILHGRRPVTAKVAARMGWKRLTVFVRGGDDGKKCE